MHHFQPTLPALPVAPLPDRIDELARAMVEANAEGNGATREVLLELGFAPHELDAHGAEASRRAGAMFLRQDDRPAYDRGARISQGAEMALSLFPDKTVTVLHLLSRGFSKPEIEDILPDIITTAADRFAAEAGAP